MNMVAMISGRPVFDGSAVMPAVSLTVPKDENDLKKRLVKEKGSWVDHVVRDEKIYVEENDHRRLSQTGLWPVCRDPDGDAGCVA
jgi:hypothetical protein